MEPNVGRAVAALERMTVKQLRQKYAEVFGEETNGHNKAWLVKRIAWRMQARAEGGLSQAGTRTKRITGSHCNGFLFFQCQAPIEMSAVWPR